MIERREKWARVRIRMVSTLFILFFVAVAARVIFLQVIERERFVKLAEKQHQKVVMLTPARGPIYDATHAALALSVEMDSCYAEPHSIENIGETAVKLAPLLGMNREVLERKLKGSKNFVWLQRRISPELARKIRDLDLDGIGFAKESKRFYPNAEMAAHVIGFTGLDPDGLEGVERRFNATILGSTGYQVTERDALGRDITLKDKVVKSASKGNSVTLTLDKNIQYIVEKELAKAVTSSGAKAGTAVVMEPQSGKVLAMATYPGFNPNSYAGYGVQQLRNRPITDSFEPGSTFKVFLIAAALEEKLISPKDGFNCENGSFNIGGRTIHDTHKYGRLSVGEIIKYSSNIGAAKIGARLGSERLFRYLKGFGFGEKSGVDLPGEVSGNLRDRRQWFAVDLATVSFGQGVTATALQLATAASAIANGGVLMKPMLVEKISSETGETLQQFAPQERRRVISAETARTVAGMMEGVTVAGGTGMNAAVDGYSVAGKTGTAQKADPITHGYSVDKRTASFVGFVPVANPKLTIIVVIDEPKTSPYGGVVAAPAFSAIAQQSLCYLKVQPEKEPKKQPETVEVKATEPATALTAMAEGGGSEPEERTVMPNFRGMSIREVLRAMERRSLNVRLLGSGRAVEQNPPPGTRVGPADKVWVRFAPSA
jgi:cell division protein FtsI (penicillin-binding protein 3)